MPSPLEKMITIYCPNDEDWMGFRLTKSNIYTFHHIVKKADGGECSVENGAILTKKAHNLLNFLELHYPSYYNEWQKIFIQINSSSSGPDEEMMILIKELKEKCLILTHGR